MSPKRRPEAPRADRVLPGVWRLRLPLPWPGVPHGNAWAVSAGDGIVLFDTGIGGEGRLANLEQGLSEAGFGLTDVGLVVCTHTHADHYGLAGPIKEASGAEVWIHPKWDHVRAYFEDPDGSLDQRIEVARQSGVPAAALERYESRRGEPSSIEALVPPDRELLPGVEVETDLGNWSVHETPGHAPSHVCLFQPESGLLISGDHLLGRISLFFDYGHSPDPVGEYLRGLDEIDGLPAGLCLSGHGRPFRDVQAKIAATRAETLAQLGRVRQSVKGPGDPKTAFETVPDLIGQDNMNPAMAAWGLQIALAYLDHLALQGEVESFEDGGEVRWRSA